MPGGPCPLPTPAWPLGLAMPWHRVATAGHTRTCCCLHIPGLWSCSPEPPNHSVSRWPCPPSSWHPSGRCPCGDSARQAGSAPDVTTLPSQGTAWWPQGSQGGCGLALGDNWGWWPWHRVLLAPATVEATTPCLSFPSSHTSPVKHFPLLTHWGGFSKKHFVRCTNFFFLRKLNISFIFMCCKMLPRSRSRKVGWGLQTP